MRFAVALVAALVWVGGAQAHLVAKPKGDSLQAVLASQTTNLKHAKYVCRHGARAHKRWSCRAVAWLTREVRETEGRLHPQSSARDRAIAAAWEIASEGGNPWPNCPDPYRDGATWDDTKACESPGYGWDQDPPGYFCGPLQFDPQYWADVIRRYGIPC